MPVQSFAVGLQVPACAIFGLYDSSSKSGYVAHVGLADEEYTLSEHCSPPWFHIWPAAGTNETFYGGDHDFARPDLIGFIGDLSADEYNRLLTSKSHMDTLGQADPVGYIDDHHPAVWELELHGRVCYRFTCVGVILKCYDDAQLPLLATDRPNFPRRELPSHAHAGRLPYVAPAYVFHALARDPQTSRDASGRYVPYVPRLMSEVVYRVHVE